MSFSFRDVKGSGWVDDAGRPLAGSATVVGQAAALPAAMSVSFLPETRSSSRQRSRATSGAVPLKRSDSTLMMTIAGGPEGTMEHWKNLAKKAEADLILEQEQHRRDSEQDFEALSRLSRRISLLEAAADDRDIGLSNHKKKIKVLRDQLSSASKRFERELEFVKLQAEEIKLKLSLVVAESDQKIGGMKQEIQISEFKRQMLQSQLDELLKLLEEPLDRLGRSPMLEEKDDSCVSTQKGDASDSSFGFLKRVIGFRGKPKQGRLSRSGTPVQSGGFLSGLMHRKEAQPLSDPINDSQLLRARVEKSFVAEKIIQIRGENARLTKELADKSEKLTTVSREAERLKRTVREAASQRESQERLEARVVDITTQRDAAYYELKEAEKMLDSLDELDRCVSASAASYDVEQLMSATSSAHLEPGHKNGQAHHKLIKVNDAGLENSRWFLSLKRLHGSCGDVVFKMDASFKAAWHLQKEKETLNAMMLEIREQLLSHPTRVRPESPGLLRMLNFSKEGNAENEAMAKFREQDPFQIFCVIKEQKLKLLKAQGAAEDWQKAKTAVDALMSDHEVKMSELQLRIQQLESEKKGFLTTLHSVYDSLPPSQADEDANDATRYVAIIHKLQQLIREKDEMKALNRRFIELNTSLEQELSTLKLNASETCILVSAIDGILELEQTHGAAFHGTWELKIAAESMANRAKNALTGETRGQEKVLDKVLKQMEELEDMRELKKRNTEEIAELSIRIEEMESALDFMGSEEDIEEPKQDRERSKSVFRIKQMKLQKDKLEATSKDVISKLMNAERENEELHRVRAQHAEELEEKLTRAHLEKEEAERKRREHEGRVAGSLRELDHLKQQLKNVQRSIKDHAMSEAQIGELAIESDDSDLLRSIERLKTELSILRAGKSLDTNKLQDLQAQLSEAAGTVLRFNEIVDRHVSSLKDATAGSANEGPTNSENSLAGSIRAIENKVVELQMLRDQEKLGLLAEIDAAKHGAHSLHGKVGELDELLVALKAEYAEKVHHLKMEIRRLGGCDVDDEMERHRRQVAFEKVKDILVSGAALAAQHAHPDHPTLVSSPGNPLGVLASFEAELLVNSKVHQQLRIGGTMGGVCQAAIHYFRIDPAVGEVSFEDATMPGSQSSNMLLDLVLMPEDEESPYESQPGDILGLCVKVMTFHDKNSREVLYNNNVIRTDEVMDAIRGQTIENFSLWPDLVSSWRWERTNMDRWTLVCVRWRFLLKNIFPELSDPLQMLAIGQHNLRASTALIRTV